MLTMSCYRSLCAFNLLSDTRNISSHIQARRYLILDPLESELNLEYETTSEKAGRTNNHYSNSNRNGKILYIVGELLLVNMCRLLID